MLRRTPKPKPTKRVAPVYSGTPNAMDAIDIANIIQRIAQLLELTDGNAFKVRAYDNAARVIPGLGDDLVTLLQSGELQKVQGIGASIAEKVATLAYTGQLDYLNDLESKVPAGLLEILHVPGLGPKKIKMLYEELGIENLDALAAICQTDELSSLKGFGKKTQANIQEGIERYRRINSRFLWETAHEHARDLLSALTSHRDVERVEIAGSLRRRRETVKDVDFVVSTKAPLEVSEFFANGPWSERVIGSGSTKTSIVHSSGIQMDLRVVMDREFPYALHHFTGSKAHNVAMRSRAIRMDMKLNEYGLFRSDELIPCEDEKSIFAVLDLKFVPPELREDQGEIQAAATNSLPDSLVCDQDICGSLGLRPFEGGGIDAAADWLQAAEQRGWQYIGLELSGARDSMPGGLPRSDLVRVCRQLQDQLKSSSVAVHIGVAVAIGRHGEISMDDEILEAFDYVRCSVADHFDLVPNEQTARILKAIQHPKTSILGSPTGRVLEAQKGMSAEWNRIFSEASRCEVLLEIDAHPQRMDLSGEQVKQGRERGASFIINPQAHNIQDLQRLTLGLGMARRGWLQPQELANTWSAPRMLKFLR